MGFSNTFELIFTEGQSVILSLDGAINFVRSNLPGHAIEKKIDLKSRFIIGELLTNAVKHAGHTQTVISILIDAEMMIIKKTDSGNQFKPYEQGTWLAGPAEHRTLLYADSFHSMYALGNNDMIKFICEENDQVAAFSANDLMEHFGLLIITKAADEFTYRYDNSSGLNTFSALLNFK